MKKSQRNLHVLINTSVNKVLLEKSGNKHKAIGVEIYHNGKTYTVKSSKEVILSAGSYGSPKILLHSGVGDKNHLDDVGIETKVNLKGVG